MLLQIFAFFISLIAYAQIYPLNVTIIGIGNQNIKHEQIVVISQKAISGTPAKVAVIPVHVKVINGIGTQNTSSYEQELVDMQECGMNTLQILDSTSLSPVGIMGEERSLGSVEIGKIVNWVVLDANPMEDLRNLSKVSTVRRNGFNVNVDSITPLALVIHQVNAYNTGNLEAFLETYANDIEIYDFPDKLLVKGKEEMKKVYGKLFRSYPELHCEVKDSMIQGSTVILKEHINGMEPETLQSLVIYEITENKISKVYFINQ